MSTTTIQKPHCHVVSCTETNDLMRTNTYIKKDGTVSQYYVCHEHNAEMARYQRQTPEGRLKFYKSQLRHAKRMVAQLEGK